MKRVGQLFERVAAFENLERAFRLARRARPRCAEVIRYGYELEQLIRRKIKDRSVLELLERLIREGPVDPEVGPERGIPIGNLTSQLFANVYLDPLDHLAKERLGLRRYARYVDDFVAVHGDKARLHQAKAAIDEFLRSRLRLRLHPKKATVSPVRAGVDFLGYRVWPYRMRVRRANVRRFIRANGRAFRPLRSAAGTGTMDRTRACSP